jgi:hypothetical protein
MKADLARLIEQLLARAANALGDARAAIRNDCEDDVDQQRIADTCLTASRKDMRRAQRVIRASQSRERFH